MNVRRDIIRAPSSSDDDNRSKKHVKCNDVHMAALNFKWRIGTRNGEL
jgi:hypothetical protein